MYSRGFCKPRLLISLPVLVCGPQMVSLGSQCYIWKIHKRCWRSWKWQMHRFNLSLVSQTHCRWGKGLVTCHSPTCSKWMMAVLTKMQRLLSRINLYENMSLHVENGRNHSREHVCMLMLWGLKHQWILLCINSKSNTMYSKQAYIPLHLEEQQKCLIKI